MTDPTVPPSDTPAADASTDAPPPPTHALTPDALPDPLDLLDDEGRQRLAEMEERRQASIKTRQSILLSGAVIALIPLFGITELGQATLLGGVSTANLVAAAIIVGLITLAGWLMTGKILMAQGEAILLHRMSQALGLAYSPMIDSFPVARFHKINLITLPSRTRMLHEVSGRYRDLRFQTLHADLRRNRGRRSRGQFVGLLLAIELPHPVPGTLVAFPRKRGVSFWLDVFGHSLPEVATDHPRLAEAYRLHSDNPDLVAEVLTPETADRLMDSFAELFGDKPVRFALQEEALLIAVDFGANPYALPKLTTPFTDPDWQRGLVKGLHVVPALIDRLLGEDEESGDGDAGDKD